MNPIHVTYRREPDGTWLVHVDGDDRLHTYGRTVNRARAAIREVIAMWHDTDEDDVELVERLELDNLGGVVAKARHEREHAATAEHQAMTATADAARRLREAGVSLRDAADLLGVSFQRVHQLVSPAASARPGGS